MIRRTVSELAPLSQAEREAIRQLPRTVAAHDAHLAGLPCMTSVELGGAAPDTPLSFPFTVAAWNLERCLFPDESAELLAEAGAQVVLLSEMDHGMARSGQAHTTARLAGHLDMAYAYGVEFVELGLGSDTERKFCVSDRNDLGWHGNGVLAATALSQPFLLRLPGRRFWFLQGGDQPRLGERMAIGATVRTAAGLAVMVSTHLESNATAGERCDQIASLIDSLEVAFPGLPLLIGGDLNTGNHIGGDWRAETLFDLARARGFGVHGGPEEQMTTRPSLITRWPERAMKLDWFLARGLDVGRSWIVPSTSRLGKPLSDHDLLLVEIEGFTGS